MKKNKTSKIEWTHETWNFVWGCDGGCDYCYARNHVKRFAAETAKKEAKFREKENNKKNLFNIEEFEEINIYKSLKNFKPTPLYSQYEKKFKKNTKLVFVNSMSDIAFWKRDWIYDLLLKISLYPEINFQILTKFPDKIKHIDFPNNVWLGITAENNINYKTRMLDLLRIKAGKHFVSLEPLQEAIDISYLINVIGSVKTHNQIKQKNDYVGKLDWVIVGGQSGKNPIPKPMHPTWVLEIRDACQEYNIPFFFKGWGSWTPYKPKDKDNFKYVDYKGNIYYSSSKFSAIKMYKVSKKEAGRELLGKEFNEFPK